MNKTTQIFNKFVVSLKCIEQNVNNQSLTQVSQLYVHNSFCFEVIRYICGHGHVICMGDCAGTAVHNIQALLYIWVLQCHLQILIYLQT